MSRIDTKLSIYPKLEKLIVYSKNLLVKFPKSERYALSTHILNNLYDSLEYVISAYKEEDKKVKLQYLKKIDVKILVLKTNIKIAFEFKYITPKNFMNWNNYVDEIGKMLGGWIKICLKESI